ncbi:MAG TPA: SLC13 family permease [Syntrophomonadaceae bacterium]|nr:SLC13 family permease [Syntrophomonadaceae bacterium]
MNKKNIGFVLAIVIIIATYFMPAPEALGYAGKMSLGLLLAAVVLWVSETFPVSITGFLLMLLISFFGIKDLNSVFQSFISPVIFFVIATFGITAIIMKTELATRLAGILLKWAGGVSNKIVLAFMGGTALLSAVMSDMAATFLFLGIVYSLLKPLNAKPGESNLGKCLMLGVPLGAMAGGASTPAGSALNMMAIDLLGQHYGMTISFLDWMVIGIPISIIMVLTAWFFVTKILKPEDIASDALVELETQIANLGKLTFREKKVLTLVTAMLICWVLGSWIPVLNTTTVAMVGLIIMFLPGVNLLEGNEFFAAVPWNIVLMIGSIQAFAAVALETGAARFLTDSVLSITGGLGTFGVLAVLATFLVLLHSVFPIGPAGVGLFLIPMADIGLQTGMFSPAVAAIMVALAFEACYLLPLNPNILITYNDGYYSMSDVIKPGVFITFTYILLMVFWLPFIVSVLGL